MTDCIRLIVVEDNDDMFENYQDTANEKNTDMLRVEIFRQVSADEARRALMSKNFDGAIVDLNLDQTTPMEASGNDVLKEIVDQHRFPVFVVSGNLQNLDSDLREKSSEFLKFFDRETPNDEIFDGLIHIFNTGITKILGGRGQIEQSLGEIFWNHLASDFSIWSMNNGGKERTLLRYTVSHLAEYLDIPDGEDRFYHEAEFYIKPPIKEIVATGDILDLGGRKYINLTPSCDVALRDNIDGIPMINAGRIILAPLIEVDRNSFIDSGLIKDQDNANNRKKVLEDIIKGKRERFSFLPGYGQICPSAVDFQNIQTYSFQEILSANRIATVSGVFLKDIQSRFSAYLGRQGQPDLDKAKLVSEYKALLSSIDR